MTTNLTAVPPLGDYSGKPKDLPAFLNNLRDVTAALNRGRHHDTNRLFDGDGGNALPLMPGDPGQIIFVPGANQLQQKQAEADHRYAMDLFNTGVAAEQAITLAFHQALHKVQRSIAPNGFTQFGTLRQIYDRLLIQFAMTRADIAEINESNNNFQGRPWDEQAELIATNLSPICQTVANKLETLLSLTAPRPGVISTPEHEAQHALNNKWLHSNPPVQDLESLCTFVRAHRGIDGISAQANLTMAVTVTTRDRPARNNNRAQTTSTATTKTRGDPRITDRLTLATPGQAEPDSRPPNNAVGKPYCVCHGWQPMGSKHNSGSCRTIENDPSATPEIKSIVQPRNFTINGRSYVGSTKDHN